jgi:CheY-like chemotaxis protein
VPKSIDANLVVLIADDDSNDTFFLRRAFEKAALSPELFEVSDGEKAISYLSGTDEFADRAKFPFPTLLLLDLKMPKLSGFEVLQWLSQQPINQRKPNIVVLSSSGLPSDIQKALALGAQDYRVKPGDIDEMISMVKEVATQRLVRGFRP